MDEKDIIASNITYLRKKMGLSQLELADKIQYSNKNISKWEKAETTPSVFTLKRLAEIFQISVDELVSVNQQEKAETASETIPVTDEPFKEVSDKKDFKVILGLTMSIKLLYLLMAEATLIVLGFIAVIVLGLLDVTAFNKWIILLYITPAMALGVFVFIICVKKRVDVISMSLFGWLLTLCFYVSFIEVKNIYLIFFLMAAVQLLIICIMLLINLNIIRHIKNKLLRKENIEKTDL